MIADRPEGLRALRNTALLTKVREHKLLLFKRRWEKLEEAKPGTLRLAPQDGIKEDLAKDYAAMSGMMFGDPPSFEWAMEVLGQLEERINHKLL
jgi:hypothetical protein